jgi:LPXTG-motif cell wall-anchored protein
MLSAAVRALRAGAAGAIRPVVWLFALLFVLCCQFSATAGPALAAGRGVAVQLTADEGQDPYRPGARVDVRVRLECSRASACGPVELVVAFDRSLAFESYSVVNDRLTDPNHYPDVTADVAPERTSFTIGTTEPMAAGSSVVIPISARGKAIPDDGLLAVEVAATTADGSSRASLRLAVAEGRAPVSALSNLTLRASPSSISPARGTPTVRFVVANDGDAPVAAGWRVTVLVPAGVRIASLSGSGLRCSGATCTAADGLAPGGTAPALTAVLRVNGPVPAKARVVAYVRPATGDVAERVAAGKAPLVTTNARTSDTDNDAMVVFSPDGNSDRLPYTGGREVRGILTLGLLLVAVGGGLLTPRWRRAAN